MLNNNTSQLIPYLDTKQTFKYKFTGKTLKKVFVLSKFFRLKTPVKVVMKGIFCKFNKVFEYMLTDCFFIFIFYSKKQTVLINMIYQIGENYKTIVK